MNPKGIFRITLMLGSAAILAGCNLNDHPLALFASVPSDDWKPSEPVELLIPEEPAEAEDHYAVPDSLKKKNRRKDPRLELLKKAGPHETPLFWVRYNLKAPQRVTLIAMAESFMNPALSDTITFDLFSPQGTPLGKGNRGVYETSLPLERLVSYPLPEGWQLTVYPLTPVSGISEVGLNF